MREYTRAHAPGGRFFLTLVTHERAAILTVHDHVDRLRAAFAATMIRHPFRIWGAVILPDHLHLLMELPRGDADFSTRIALIKSQFVPVAGAREPGTERLNAHCRLRAPFRSASRQRRRERAIWQRRFWEHTIRDERDFDAHMDYIHFNPVKHGFVACPHAWSHSSFHRCVREGRYTPDWACSCRTPTLAQPPSVVIAERTAGE